MKKFYSLLIIPLLLLLTHCGIDKHLEIYICISGSDQNNGAKENPVRTFEKAFQLVKDFNQKSDNQVIIHLFPGDYHLSSPLIITPELNNLSIIGTGMGQVNLKGSRGIEADWNKYSENIWTTNVPKGLDFDQLFINGKKQILARYPNFNENGGYWQGYAADAISTVRVSTWKNPVGGFVHAMHRGRWGDFHYMITDVNENGEVTLIGGHQNNRPSPMHPELRMVENIFEELDSEQEWYLDKANNKLYLWPENNVDLSTALVEVSILKHLIEIRGMQENPTKNIFIEGIRFEHSNRTFMDVYEPLLRSDWTIYRGGAISLEGVENCTINSCEFTNLGGNVIFTSGYNRNISIIGNHIHHCGASAISFVGDASAVRSPSFQYNQFVPFNEMDTVAGPANDLYPSGCKVENNLIYKIGCIEKQVAGVQISMAMKINVKNNSIYAVPRAGINISEGTWGGHIIEYNDVFNTVQESGDHGSFNSWGRDRFWHPNWNTIDSLVRKNPRMPYWDAMHTTIIRNNRFRCDHGWDIDLDDGSSNYRIYNNLCLNGGIKLREGYNRIVENNIMVNNGFHPHVWFANSNDVFRKNIVMLKHSDIWLRGWGKVIDNNFFPDSFSLAKAHENNTDANSMFGNPLFVSPEKGDFRVEDSSMALQIGFINFPMDSFGVLKPELKAIAKQPDIPQLNITSFQKEKSKTRKWFGGTIKNIETSEEQSASGLHEMSGVLILKVQEGSKMAASGIDEGDVIIKVEGEEIKNINNLLSNYQANAWHGSVKMTIFRHQKEIELSIKSQ